MNETWIYGLGVFVVLIVLVLAYRNWKARKTGDHSKNIYPFF